MWDVYAGRQILVETIAGSLNEKRRLAHQIADAFYREATERGTYFDSEIVYVAEAGSAKDRQSSEIWSRHNFRGLKNHLVPADLTDLEPDVGGDRKQ